MSAAVEREGDVLALAVRRAAGLACEVPVGAPGGGEGVRCGRPLTDWSEGLGYTCRAHRALLWAPSEGGPRGEARDRVLQAAADRADSVLRAIAALERGDRTGAADEAALVAHGVRVRSASSAGVVVAGPAGDTEIAWEALRAAATQPAPDLRALYLPLLRRALATAAAIRAATEVPA